MEIGEHQSVEYCFTQAKTCESESRGLRAKYRELCETFLGLACHWRQLADQIDALQRDEGYTTCAPRAPRRCIGFGD
jgi:hypothetical protein